MNDRNKLDYSKVARADPDEVRRLADHLVEAFEAYIKAKVDADPTGRGVAYIDSLMGWHNAYKRIILDLCEREPLWDKTLRECAVATLAKALLAPGQWKDVT